MGRGQAAPWMVLALALALTFATTAFVAAGTRGRDEARFDNAVQNATDRLIARLEVYISTLRGGASLFAADGGMDAERFQRYADRLELERWYPGIQGFGWTERIETGLDGEVDEVHAIRFLEPMDERNQAAIGYDMYSEPVRRAAMRRARDLAEPAMSGRVILVQEIFGEQSPGFLIYVPVYVGGEIPADVASRRDRLLGFVYAPFRAPDLFDRIYGTEAEPRVDFAVYDGMQADTASLLFVTSPDAGQNSRRSETVRLEIAGHPWTVVFTSRPEFDATSARGLVPLVFIAGLLGTLWLFRLARGQARARAVAEHANQAKSLFLATMSHELRTPLNAIGGYVDLILLGVAGPVSDKQDEYLTRVMRAQKHLLGLINDVLNFAKLDAGRVHFNARPVSAGDAVGEAASMVAVQAEQLGLNFTVAGGPDVQAVCDPEKLRQILLNLYSNALKFTPRGGAVATRWQAVDSVVEILVSDTGTGIEPDRVDEIFEPFLQVDADLTRQGEGTGLGLSISRALARGMGGDIRVTSTPGAGSTFIVSLPRHLPDVVAESGAAA
ncbi:MAG TPA: CHASE domain-containing protein [Longimicrobiales bacterium]|nr:CHASE domain-containing protein [Longimicrobiales bacterium]